MNPVSKNTSNRKMSVWGFILRCVALIAVPIAYPFLCGLIFDMWLKWYDALPFIFYSLITLYIVCFVLLVLVVIRFIRQRIKR